MRIGYACLALGVPGSGMKRCTLKNATDARLLEIIGHNLHALNVLVDYNIANKIPLFRISSDLIPFGSSLARNLAWPERYADLFAEIGYKIKKSGMRISMHPGQYTVLNSPDRGVVERAVDDLEYHNIVLDQLGVNAEHKLILHTGGVYDDKALAKQRFSAQYKLLSPSVRDRLVLENDDRLFTIEDVLDISADTGIPVVYDNHHNAVNPSRPDMTDRDWIERCIPTWEEKDGRPKIHYSQQDPGKRRGAHSATIAIDAFLTFYEQIPDVDIMLEVKDKNVSAVRCLNCTTRRGISALENEWARYKYSVLEHDHRTYEAIRNLLKDKRSYPALEMYRLIESALQRPIEPGSAVNAIQHVWGYVKDQVEPQEKRRFDKALQRYIAGDGSLQAAKNVMHRLAQKYKADYLLRSYYFEIKEQT